MSGLGSCPPRSTPHAGHNLSVAASSFKISSSTTSARAQNFLLLNNGREGPNPEPGQEIEVVERASVFSPVPSAREPSPLTRGGGEQRAEGSRGVPGAGKRTPSSRRRRRRRACGQHLAQPCPGVENDEPREGPPDHRSEDSEQSEDSSGAKTHGLAIDDGVAGSDSGERCQAREAERSRGRSPRKERRSHKKATRKSKRARSSITSSSSSDSTSSSSESKEEWRRSRMRSGKRSSGTRKESRRSATDGRAGRTITQLEGAATRMGTQT